MIHPIHLLLAGTMGLLFFVLVLIFWAVSALGSLAKKQKQREQAIRDALQLPDEGQQRLQIPNEIRRRLQLPPQRAQQLPQPRGGSNQPHAQRPQIPKIAQRMPAKLKKQGRQPAVRQVAQPVASRPLSEPEPPVERVTPAKQTAAPARSAPLPATATMISRWLNPATLRSQFILTELFQPPLALRPPNDRRFE